MFASDGTPGLVRSIHWLIPMEEYFVHRLCYFAFIVHTIKGPIRFIIGPENPCFSSIALSILACQWWADLKNTRVFPRIDNMSEQNTCMLSCTPWKVHQSRFSKPFSEWILFKTAQLPPQTLFGWEDLLQRYPVRNQPNRQWHCRKSSWANWSSESSWSLHWYLPNQCIAFLGNQLKVNQVLQDWMASIQDHGIFQECPDTLSLYSSAGIMVTILSGNQGATPLVAELQDEFNIQIYLPWSAQVNSITLHQREYPSITIPEKSFINESWIFTSRAASLRSFMCKCMMNKSLHALLTAFTFVHYQCPGRTCAISSSNRTHTVSTKSDTYFHANNCYCSSQWYGCSIRLGRSSLSLLGLQEGLWWGWWEWGWWAWGGGCQQWWWWSRWYYRDSLLGSRSGSNPSWDSQWKILYR